MSQKRYTEQNKSDKKEYIFKFEVLKEVKLMLPVCIEVRQYFATGYDCFGVYTSVYIYQNILNGTTKIDELYCTLTVLQKSWKT